MADTDTIALANQAKERGNKCFSSQDYAGALAAFTEAISLDPTNEVFYSNRSAVHRTLKDLPAALEDANKCISLKPTWARGHSRKGAVYEAMGDLESAKSSYEEAIKCDPKDEQSKSALAKIEAALSAPAAGSSSSSSAESPMENMFGLDTLFSDPVVWAEVLQRPEFTPFITPSLMSTIDAIRKNPSLAMQSMQSGDPVLQKILQAVFMAKLAPMAEKAQRQEHTEAPAPSPAPKKTEPEKPVVELSESEKEALAAKDAGNKLYQAKDWEGALVQYSKAVELDPNNLLYRLNRASVFMMQGKYEECLQECDESLAHGRSIRAPFEQIAKALHRKGRCYLRMNDLDNAIKFFDQSLTEHRTAECLKDLRDTERLRDRRAAEQYLDPEISLQEKALGAKAFESGDYPEAVARFTEAIKRNPKDHTLFSNRSFAYFRLGALKESLADADQALVLDPKFVKAYIRKAQVYRRTKEYHKAIAALEKGLEVDPTSVALKEELQAVLGLIHQRRASGQIDKEAQQRAMADPEIQRILANPEVQTFLRESQSNAKPKELSEMLTKRPALAKHIDTLMAAGVI